jgi:hypothetical protein
VLARRLARRGESYEHLASVRAVVRFARRTPQRHRATDGVERRDRFQQLRWPASTGSALGRCKKGARLSSLPVAELVKQERERDDHIATIPFSTNEHVTAVSFFSEKGFVQAQRSPDYLGI